MIKDWQLGAGVSRTGLTVDAASPECGALVELGGCMGVANLQKLSLYLVQIDAKGVILLTNDIYIESNPLHTFYLHFLPC